MSLHIEELKIPHPVSPLLQILCNGTVSAGERVILRGRSGCGKTTLLKALAGLYPTSSGRIFLEGRELEHLRPQQRRVGFMFQSAALWMHLSVIENLTMALRFFPEFKVLSEDLRTQRAREYLERMNLLEKSNASPETLSGGERQRLSLARALIIAPKYLLLDEPLSALDTYSRSQVIGQMKEILATLQIPVLIVSHQGESSEELGTREVFWNEEKHQCVL